jgi:hypothetical protein
MILSSTFLEGDAMDVRTLAIVAAGGLSAAAHAQSPWVIPPQYANTAGTGAAVWIYDNGPITYQFTVPGSDFTSAPGLTLVGMSHRLRSTAATSWPPVGATFNNYDVYIGELANTSGVLHGTFALNVVPGTEVQVRSGPMTIPAGSFISTGSLPNPFSTHTVDFQFPFTIEPAKQYIFTVRHTGHNTTDPGWDRIESGGLYAGRGTPSYTGTVGTLANWNIPQFWVTQGPPACYANCDGSTTEPVLNVADFTCFLSKFAAGDPYANCDGSTTEPTLNVADFTCFLSKFAAGCP